MENIDLLKEIQKMIKGMRVKQVWWGLIVKAFHFQKRHIMCTQLCCLEQCIHGITIHPFGGSTGRFNGCSAESSLWIMDGLRVIFHACTVGEGGVAHELIDNKRSPDEIGRVCSISDTLSASSETLPSCQDVVQLCDVQEVDWIIGSIERTHGSSDETTDVDADKQMQLSVEESEFRSGYREEVPSNHISIRELLVFVLALETAATRECRETVLANSHWTRTDTIVRESSRISKSVGVRPDGSCVWCNREWRPVVVRNGKGTVVISQEVLELLQEVPIVHEELAIAGRGGMCD